MAFIPLALAAIPAIMSAISGGVGIASAVKQLRGGRIRRHRHARAHPGKGLSPMKIYRPYCGYGLLKPAGGLLHPAGYGYGLSPMKIYRPYAGYGLRKRKAPKRKHVAKKKAGGRLVHKRRAHRRGHGMLYPPGGKHTTLLKAILGRLPASPPPIPLAKLSAGTGYSTHDYYPGSPFKATGGRLMRMPLRHRGKGAIADFLGGIPLLGAIAGPLARALGGKLHKRRHHKKGGRIVRKKKGGRIHHMGHVGGRHGNLHRMSSTIGAILRGGNGVVHHRRPHYRHVAGRRVHVPATLVRKGGAVHYRRPHYKHVAGKRVYVRPATVHRGGYIPYTWRR